ncbi:MAG: hypothetical protein HKN07_01800 [Acidimicrobiia bacterium]|nr:hypothetical protein [Acidimicrobiia bacterium]
MSRASLVVIKWRDIPAQVVAKRGRESERLQLPPRFAAAIDRAAMLAGRTDFEDYIEEWRREATPCGDDLEAEVASAATRLDNDYPMSVLNKLVENKGYQEPS